MSKITINLSQSALGYHGCIEELRLTAIDGYCTLPSSNIVYGEAIHKYRHIMFQTNGHIPTARDEAIKTFNQPKLPAKKASQHMDDQRHMMTTAYQFWEDFVCKDTDTEYVLLDRECWKCGGKGEVFNFNLGETTRQAGIDEDKPAVIPCPTCNGEKILKQKPATEVSFSIKYYEDDYIIVNLCGTLDGLAKIKGGCYIIPDIKTTSAWDRAGYFGTYKMSRQLRLYRLALLLMSEMFPDSVLGQIGKTQVGARIDAVFIKPSPVETKFVSSDVFQFRDSDIADFRRMIDSKILELSKAVAQGYFPKQGILNNSCIGKWGMCQFSDVCNSTKEVGDILLKRDFKVRQFNPLNYSGI